MNFIGFAFKPAMGFFLAIIGLLCVLLMGFFFWFSMSAAFIITWVAYLVSLVAFLAGSWISWVKYRDPLQKMQPWDGKKGEYRSKPPVSNIFLN